MRHRAVPLPLPLPLLLLSPLLLAPACGNDTQSKMFQLDDPIDAEHLFEGAVDDRECVTAANCEDGDLCTEHRCVDRVCVDFTLPTEECCATEELFFEGFDGDIAEGVTFSTLNGAAAWHVIGDRAASPPGALYFGDPERMSYDVGVHVAGEVTLPAFDLPVDREAVFTMRLLALIETSPAFDLFRVEVDVIELGEVVETRTLIAKRDLPVAAYQDFALVSADLEGLAGRRVVLRIGFDSVDATNNAYEGVWIDDLRLLASCPLPTACVDDASCSDGDACTANACTSEGCVATNVCELPDPDEPAGPQDPCAEADAPADCCTTDADCEDGDQATVNVCDGATCVVTLNPDGCLVDADCDDGDACTTETCNADGVCDFRGTLGDGCCAPGSFQIADFDNETLQGIYVTDNYETGIFWTPDKTRSTSGHFALYCGDPVTQSYAYDRRVKSSATTRPLAIPSGGNTQLVFDLYKDTRLALNYDVFQVFVLRDGALLPAWTSKQLKNGTTEGGWQRVVVPLSSYAGQEIQVRFVFDSVDGAKGAFEGVYIDTLKLDTLCQ